VVDATAYHGLDLQLRVRTPASGQPLTVRLTADTAATRPFAPGDAVTLHFSPTNTRLFPA
jgi:hypothetical protein